MINDHTFLIFDNIISEMKLVYMHDDRPWLIGYSGGKDSSLLVSLVFQTVQKIPVNKRTKKIYVVTSDTMVENPIVKEYMHSSSEKINKYSIENKMNIQSVVIYPEIEQSFWCRLIGLGYPTPEAPGFRWCTERLKIQPMNSFVFNCIKKNGEIIILLGVRKAESETRNRSITSREIEGKLLSPHNDISGAFVYNPLTEVPNALVWEYLLKDDGLSPWGTDFKYLFSLYQGESINEEQSVLGEIDKTKIPSTGNSRFGCWCCTIVSEDKSLQSFIDKGSSWLIPLREFRNWLVSIRNNPDYRDNKRRNGTMYKKANGEYGLGPFTLAGRQKILKKLLELQQNTGLTLITEEELKVIDQIWDNEGDLSKRILVDTYFEVFNQRLPWDQYKIPLFNEDSLKEMKEITEKNSLSFELATKMISSVEKNKHSMKSTKMNRELDKIVNQDWVHQEVLEDGFEYEN